MEDQAEHRPVTINAWTLKRYQGRSADGLRSARNDFVDPHAQRVAPLRAIRTMVYDATADSELSPFPSGAQALWSGMRPSGAG